MSAIAATAVPARGTSPNPVLRVARLELVAWPNILIWPWGILALSFAVNLAVFGLVDDAQGSWTGGLMSIYIVRMIGTVQLFTRGLPFALGMSVTRRAYYLGTWLFAVVEAFVFGAVLLGLRYVEDATDGWGMGLEYFGFGFTRDGNVVQDLLVYVVPFLFMAALGACLGLVMKRWSYNGLLTVIAGTIVLAGAAVILIARQNWWSPIGDWFTDQSATALFAGWPAVPALVLAAVGYAVIRRATP